MVRRQRRLCIDDWRPLPWLAVVVMVADAPAMHAYWYAMRVFLCSSDSSRTPMQSFRATNADDPVVVGSSLGRSVAGRGLFAQRAYRCGERITRYGGRVLSIDEARALPMRTHMRSLEPLRRVVDGSSGYCRKSVARENAARESAANGAVNIVGRGQFANTSRRNNCHAAKECGVDGLRAARGCRVARGVARHCAGRGVFRLIRTLVSARHGAGESAVAASAPGESYW